MYSIEIKTDCKSDAVLTRERDEEDDVMSNEKRVHHSLNTAPESAFHLSYDCGGFSSTSANDLIGFHLLAGKSDPVGSIKKGPIRIRCLCLCFHYVLSE
ncbi:hypothetical protein F2P81_002621 [Scophthalmus maximus]|uniref:Uncharacterized protein n=1 Tax=Scophthalmus maximus TaxID=52904 RepID=A0A6A4TVM5_SCOMX|nr:hypothetical protein F2P81_002621 [Scophthalmus maximus]